MAVVRALPANSVSAVDGSHDKLDLPLQVMSLMMRRILPTSKIC